MNQNEIRRMISQIDDEKLAASDKMAAKTKFPMWQRALAAAILFAIVLVTGLLTVPNLIRPSTTSQPTTPQESQPTTSINQITPETTTQATRPIPRWEEQAVHEKFTGDAFIDGIQYQCAVQEIDASVVKEKLGDFVLTGYDYYASQQHAINASWYALDGIDPACVVAVQYADYEGFYSFYNADYPFETLGDLIDKLDLKNRLVFNNSFQHTVWLDEDKENYWFRWDYYRLPDTAIIWDRLLSERDIPNSSDTSNKELGWEMMSISIDYPPSGQSNIGLTLFENGYLATNILGTLKVFKFGNERITAFIDYVTANGVLYDSMGGDSGTPFETTIASTAIASGDDPLETVTEHTSEAYSPVTESTTTPATTVSVSG